MNIPRTILHTEWSLGWGGQEIRILQEMEAVRARGGHTVLLACRRGSRISGEAAKRGFRVFHLPFRNGIDLLTVFLLCRLVRRERVDILHTHSSVDGWCGGFAGRLMRRKGCRVVRSRHLSSAVRPGINARLVYHHLPDRVISSGRHIRDHLVDNCGCDPARHVSIPAGADTTRFHPGVDASGVRREFGLEAGDKVVGIVAVLRSWKGHLVLLDAFTVFLRTFPEGRLLVVGEGPIRKDIEAKIAALGIGSRVVLAGHRDDVPECLKAMNVCVLPSLKNEATSQALPQAMLVGTPVIASTAGGLTEVVEENVRGRVVPPGDAGLLAEALVKTFTEPEKTRTMAEEARRHALEELSFEKQVDRTCAVYDSLF